MTSPLLVIVGETASGKSALAMQLAEKFDGEIICADSRTVYRGMDIGTAKPSPADRERVAHYCLDMVDPDESFTAADFKRCALEAIEAISAKGRLPILVGGTGLYIDAVLYDFQFNQAPDPGLRQRLTALSIEELQSLHAEQGIALPTNSRNPRHLVRSLETGGVRAAQNPLREDTLILGMSVDREALQMRIHDRVETMVEDGLVEEVRRVAGEYGWQAEALRAPGYKAFRPYLEGVCSLEEAKQVFVRNDSQLAKRQRTWFKRNKSIHWLSNRDKYTEAVELLTTLLNK